MSLLKEAFNFVLSSAQEYSMKIYEEADSLSNYSDEELLDEMNNGSGKKRIAAAFLYKARHNQTDD